MLNRVTVNGQPAARSAASTSFQDDVGQSSTWKIGLINEHGKYLTAETFGFTINAAGTSLRRKQLWTVERDPVDEDTVYFRSHLGRYLAGDRKVRTQLTSCYSNGSIRPHRRRCTDRSIVFARWRRCAPHYNSWFLVFR